MKEVDDGLRMCQGHLLLRSDKGKVQEVQSSALTQICFFTEPQDAVVEPRGIGESGYLHLRGVLMKGL